MEALLLLIWVVLVFTLIRLSQLYEAVLDIKRHIRELNEAMLEELE